MDNLDIKKILSEKDKTRVYMIENFLLIDSLPFKLADQQKEYLKALSENKKNIYINSEQVGVTSALAAYIACEMVLSSDNPKSIVLELSDDNLSHHFLKLVRNFLIQLIPVLRKEFISPTLIIIENDKIQLINKSIIFINNNNMADETVYIESMSDININNIWVIADNLSFMRNSLFNILEIINSNIEITLILNFNEIYQDILNKKNDFGISDLKWQNDSRYNEYIKFINKETIEKIDVCNSKENVLISNDMNDKINNDINKILQGFNLKTIDNKESIVNWLEKDEFINEMLDNCSKQIKFINSELGYFKINLNIEEILRRELENYFIKKI